MRVAVLGAGSWGTTVATLTAKRHDVVLWARRAEAALEINETHLNRTYLPDWPLPEELRATSDMEEAVRDADVVVVGVPTDGFRQAAVEAAKHMRSWVPVVSLAKGFEQGTRLRMTQVIKDSVAIATGMAEGLSVGDNTRAAVITRGFGEITRLGVAMRGVPATFAGL